MSSLFPTLILVIDRTLKFHTHISRNVAVLNGMTSNILRCTLSRDKDFLLNIYVSYVRPKLEYASCLWNVGYLGDVRLLERVQRRWTRAVIGFSDLSYGERLHRLNLFSFQGRLLRADLIVVWKIFHGKCAIMPEQLFVLHGDRRTRGHNFKILVPRTNLSVRSRYFSVRVISSWNSLEDDTVLADSLSKFKCLLHRDLGHALFDYLD